ncbi:MAG: hypothetical protein J5829_02030 [Lachnospiraceae bacterium]|nr:hypothetical protein [Lachnospiraceae bacterium]
MKEERLTWKEIQEKYPDQWIGLVGVEWKNDSNVASAIVKYIGKTSGELLRLQMGAEPELFSCFTTPESRGQLGVIG